MCISEDHGPHACVLPSRVSVRSKAGLLLVVGLLGTLVLAALVSLVQLHSWVVLIVVACGLALMGMVAFSLVRHRRQTLKAIRAYAPDFVMPYAGYNRAGYQLGMWEPYLHYDKLVVS